MINKDKLNEEIKRLRDKLAESMKELHLVDDPTIVLKELNDLRNKIHILEIIYSCLN